MATIKITQRTKILSNGEYPIFLRITKDRKSKYISLKLSCNISQWNEIKSEFRKSYVNYKQMNTALIEIRNRAEKIISDYLAKGEDITLEEFEALFLNFKLFLNTLRAFFVNFHCLIQDYKETSVPKCVKFNLQIEFSI